jgi:hypothetical protein
MLGVRDARLLVSDPVPWSGGLVDVLWFVEGCEDDEFARVQEELQDFPGGVIDEGRGLSGLPNAAGYGLAGMRERVALLHGEFTAGPRFEGGFRVAARLPVPAAVR